MHPVIRIGGNPALPFGFERATVELGRAGVIWLLAAGTGTGFWFLASGFWFLASGFWFLASGFWFLASGFWLLASGF